MKILLTGAAGFIGSHIAQAYLDSGHVVYAVDKKPNNSFVIKHKNCQYFRCDLTTSQFDTIFTKTKPDIVNHHAAKISVENSFQSPLDYANTNTLATIKLLNLSRQAKVKQIIFASSAAVYGDPHSLPIKETDSLNPLSFYALNKYIAEYYLKLFNTDIQPTIFRYSNIYGPRQTTTAEGGVIAIFINNFLTNQTSTINGNGEQTRDFLYVKDVARANLIASDNKISGIFNLSTNQSTTINQLYELLANILSSKQKPKYGPTKKGDIKHSVLSNKLIKKVLNWKPEFTLIQGLKSTVNAFSKNN